MDPKPITLTQVTADGYTGPEPQPMVVVGAFDTYLTNFVAAMTQLDGYDAGETQTLKNVSGTLTWVTDA